MKWKPEKMYYIFSNESCSYSQETKFPKTFFIFQETELSDISENRSFKKLMLLEISFRVRKNKKRQRKSPHILGNGTS